MNKTVIHIENSNKYSQNDQRRYVRQYIILFNEILNSTLLMTG